MRPWLRIGIKFFGILIGVLLIIWLGLRWYINEHKKEILQDITAQLSKNIGGELHITDMEPTFVLSFPYFSVALEQVSLHDSLWQYHHRDMLKAQNIFIQLNPFSLLRKKPRIHKIIVDNGTVCLFTDSNGYSNEYMLQRRDTTTVTKRRQALFNIVAFHNVQFILKNVVKSKLFKVDVRDVAGKMQYNDTGWALALNMAARVQECNFNTAKGSFLKNKLLEGDINLQYSYRQHALHVLQQKLQISGQPIVLSASFCFAKKVPSFWLDITSHKIPFRDAVSLVSPSISRHLDSFDFKQPVDIVHVYLKGNMKYRDTPTVRVNWQVTNNVMVSSLVNIDKCSFGGAFNNEVQPGYGHSDDNSSLKFYNLKASWVGIPLICDTVQVLNLRSPELFCHLRAAFPVSALNAITGGETFIFNSGSASADIVYHGGLKSSDTIPPSIQGNVRIYNAAVTYLPRNLSFADCSATLTFTGDDLLLQNVHVRSGQSILNMEGRVDNFLNLYFHAPDKMLFDWNISSPLINLNEFSAFLSKRKTVRTAVSHYNKLIVARRLNSIMDACNVKMQMHVDKLLYQKFRATNINAGVELLRNGVHVDYVNLVHAGGVVNASGDVTQQATGWQFDVKADASKVNIQQLFYSFDNFGQKAIEHDNVRGLLTAKANVKGIIRSITTSAFQLQEGHIHFILDNGALVHFEPLENISKYAFKKRNLGNITFDRLENDIDVSKNGILVNPMWIRSSAVEMHVQGLYNPPTGTNLALEVPLRNPEKKSKKGIVLYLRVSDGDNGKLKVGWDRTKGILGKFSKQKDDDDVMVTSDSKKKRS